MNAESIAIVPDPNSIEPSSLEGVEIDSQSIWASIYNNRLIIIFVPLVALAIGAAVTTFMPKRYQATATVQIEQQTSKVLSSGDTSAQPAGSASEDSERFLQTELGLLSSKALAGQVVDSLGLAKSDDALEQLGLPKRQLERLSSDNDRRATLIAVLRMGLTVTLPRDSRIAQVAVTCVAPELCAKIANAYIREFITYNLRQKYQESSYALRFLREQLQDAKARLQDSEQSAVDYARRRRLVDTGKGGGPDRDLTSTTASNLVSLNDALAAAQAAAIEAGQRWHQAQSSPVLNQPEVLQSPAVQALIERRALAQVDYQRERQRHTQNYPTTQQAASQIASLDEEINKIGQATRAGLRTRYQVALRNEQELASKINELKSQTLSERDTSIGYNILRREVDTNRTMYDGLLQRYKEVSAAAGVTAKNISAVDEAEVPSDPISPKLKLNLATAGLIGVILAIVIVILRERLFDEIRSPAELQRKLGIPLLGLFPRVTTGGGPVDAVALPRSTLSEAVVSTASATLDALPNGARTPATISVTSSKPGEGKSSFSYGIARSLARSGRKVILVDGDLRRPSVHTIFNMDNSTGLSSVLANEKDVKSVIYETSVESLLVMPAGPMPTSPAELLSDIRLNALFRELKGLADIIVIDSPPVLQLADALLIGAASDGCILIVDARSARARDTRTSWRRLRRARVNVLGSVLSNFKVKAADYEY